MKHLFNLPSLLQKCFSKNKIEREKEKEKKCPICHYQPTLSSRVCCKKTQNRNIICLQNQTIVQKKKNRNKNMSECKNENNTRKPHILTGNLMN